MHWAHTITGLSPEDRQRADDIQTRKSELNKRAAQLKDKILTDLDKLVDEEVHLYHDLARKHDFTKSLKPEIVKAMDERVLVAVLEGKSELRKRLGSLKPKVPDQIAAE